MNVLIDSSVSPSDKHLISPEPLSTSTLFKRCCEACLVGLQARMGNHNAIVDGKPLIHTEHTSTSVPCHDAHHILKPFIATHTSNDQHLIASNMSHCSLC